MALVSTSRPRLPSSGPPTQVRRPRRCPKGSRCLGLRLRRGPDPRHPQVQDAVRGRRVRPRGPGDQGGTPVRLEPRRRGPGRPVRGARRARAHPLRPGIGVYRQGSQGLGAKTAYIEKSSPWENGYVESFNGKFRDKLPTNALRSAVPLVSSFTVMACNLARVGDVEQHQHTMTACHRGLLQNPPHTTAAQPRPAPPATLRVVPRPALN
jgi:hypothetical protein